MLETKYIKVDAKDPLEELIGQAADLIKAGELVAFPTETVYGLGADAGNARAVSKVFEAKGRPQESPLLIHVSKREQVEQLAAEIPEIAFLLMDHFWPGPLAIILLAKPEVPEVVRGGKPSVGFRMPSHPVSIALINAAGPIAAPSANLYGRPSPTSPKHVRADLDGAIAAILDAGDTGAGLESTIVDLSNGKCEILRKGGVPLERIQEVLGDTADLIIRTGPSPEAYRTPVKVLRAKDEQDFLVQMNALSKQGGLGIIRFSNAGVVNHQAHSKEYYLDLSGEGSSFYSILRDAEENGLKNLLVQAYEPQSGGVAETIIDKIIRAASN